jgi:hypothetical protein
VTRVTLGYVETLGGVMRQRIMRWVEQGCERLDERMCALANLTDDGDDDALPTWGLLPSAERLGEQPA